MHDHENGPGGMLGYYLLERAPCALEGDYPRLASRQGKGRGAIAKPGSGVGK